MDAGTTAVAVDPQYLADILLAVAATVGTEEVLIEMRDCRRPVVVKGHNRETGVTATGLVMPLNDSRAQDLETPRVTTDEKGNDNAKYIDNVTATMARERVEAGKVRADLAAARTEIADLRRQLTERTPAVTPAEVPEYDATDLDLREARGMVRAYAKLIQDRNRELKHLRSKMARMGFRTAVRKVTQ